MTPIHQGKQRTFTIKVIPTGGALQPGDVPVWDVSPTGGVTLAPASDGLSCVVAAPLGGTIQTQTVKATAHSANGTELVATEDVETLATDATAIEFVIGPEETTP